MIENAELVMQMLEMYQMYKQQVPVELEEYLRYVAKTGNTLFQWTLVKPFIREKIMNVIAEFAEQSVLSEIPPYPNVDPFNYEAMKTMLLDRFDTFNGPPFTIQRLCELLSCPRKEYNRVDKFMRAVEKNILVVSTCELRPKREEPTVNGVPDRWENGKESDISMDLVDKNNVISDTSVLNGDDTVESLLNELESMKTPETKLDESKTEHKDQLVAQVTDKVESDFTSEESKQDTSVLITQDNISPQTQVTDSTEVLESVNIDDVPLNVAVEHESIVDQSKKLNSELTCEIQPVEVKEQIVNDSVAEIKDLSHNTELENVKPKTEEPIIEGNKLDNLELIPIDADRVEGSIIHQTPDSDAKVELDLVDVSQPAVVLEKSDEDLESMDVQVEDIPKIMDVQVEDAPKIMDVQVEDICKSMDVQVEDVSKSMDVQVEDPSKNMELQVEDISKSMNAQVDDLSKSIDVQVEDVSQSMESEVICDNVQTECTKSSEIRNDKQQVDESTVDAPIVDLPSSTIMDVEPEKIKNDVTLNIIPQESVTINEDIQTTGHNTIVEEPQIKDEKKSTESE